MVEGSLGEFPPQVTQLWCLQGSRGTRSKPNPGRGPDRDLDPTGEVYTPGGSDVDVEPTVTEVSQVREGEE